MSRNSISQATKKEVANRARNKCEYCLQSERVSYFRFHIEHIKSIKHGGNNMSNNLAYCCPDCNYYKGTDIGTFVGDSDNLVRFFNPRKDIWNEHFDLSEGLINGKTEIGKATVKIFRFNEIERLIFRKQLIEALLYP